MTTIQSLRDEKTGRFQTTTNSARYKNVQFNNQRMSEHAREMCIALNIPKIPKGFIVHHLDENKRNNNIDNLALITITAHNRIHSHEPWNKGVTTSDNVKWANAVIKQRIAREKVYLDKFKETYNLKNSGKTSVEIAKILGVSVATVNLRIQRYKELKLKYDN